MSLWSRDDTYPRASVRKQAIYARRRTAREQARATDANMRISLKGGRQGGTGSDSERAREKALISQEGGPPRA
jgi:hypothetical protein